jgi:hypothetical protein
LDATLRGQTWQRRYNSRVLLLRRLVGGLLLVLGAMALALCWLGWSDGSYWGDVIGWFALTWGLAFLSLGVTIIWLGTTVAGLLGTALGAASALLAFLHGLGDPEWSAIMFPCVVAGGVGALAGLASYGVARYRARKTPPQPPSERR